MLARILPSLFLAAVLLAACENPSDSKRPGAPAKLDIVSGDHQRDTVGQELPQALVVRVTDEGGRAVPDQAVEFRVTAGNGSVFAGTATTNRDGEARERWNLGTVAGDTQRVEARAVNASTGEAIVFATFRAIGVPDAPAATSVVGAPSRAGTAGLLVADSLTIKVADKHGNGISGVAVAFAAANGGTVSPATTMTGADGTARAQWTMGGTAGAQSATAAAAGFPALTFTGAAGAGAVTRLVLAPESLRFSAIGQTAALSVAAFDAFNNPVGGQQVMIVSGNSGVAALDAGATARAVSNGTARLIATVQGSTAADTTLVTVQQVARQVQVTPASATLRPGDTVQLNAVARDAGGTAVANTEFTYVSSSPAVRVSAAGLLTAVSPTAGATITVRTDSATAAATIVVGRELNVPSISVTEEHGCVLDNSGKAYCWGRGGTGLGSAALETCYPGDNGEFYNGVPCNTRPTPVTGGLTFTRLALGSAHTCGLTSGGDVYCWGNNNRGQLGDGTTTSREAPARVSASQSFVALAAGGSATCAVAVGGSGYCWGENVLGQLGDGSDLNTAAAESCAGTRCRRLPTAVAGGLTFTSITHSGFLGCALTSGGDAYCWGTGFEGALGNGTTTTSSVPVAVSGGLKFREIAAGEMFFRRPHACALTTGDVAYCWGQNEFGQLGDGTTTDRDRPVEVSGGHRFAMLTASCGVTTGGEARCWGENFRGRVGNGTTTQATTPARVSGSIAWSRLSSGNGRSTCGLGADGKAYCWGSNLYGLLGNGIRTERNSSVPVPLAASP